MPSVLLLVSRPEPAPADCSLVTEGRTARRPRVGREVTSLYSCVTIQLIDRSAAVCCRGSRLEFREHAVFRFENQMTQVVGYWCRILDQNPTIWVIGFSNRIKTGRILHIRTA